MYRELHTRDPHCGSCNISKQSASVEDSRSNQTGEVGREKRFQSQRFACPYYKYRPWQFHSSKTCSGRGWDSLHRLKEHLFRRHMKPIDCARCHHNFKTHDAFLVHLRSETPCKLASAPRHTSRIGMDERQAKAIKRRKKTGESSDEERWMQIYRTLFPDVNPNCVPSPYYEDSDLGLADEKDPQELIVETFVTWLTEHGKKTLRGILFEEIRPLHPDMEKCVTRVLERAQQAYKTLTIDFFKETDCSNPGLCATYLIPDNASSAGLGHSPNPSEMENSSAAHIRPNSQKITFPEPTDMPLSPASTESTSTDWLSSASSIGTTLLESMNLFMSPASIDWGSSASSISITSNTNFTENVNANIGFLCMPSEGVIDKTETAPVKANSDKWLDNCVDVYHEMGTTEELTLLGAHEWQSSLSLWQGQAS